MKVYLGGSINNCSDSECNDWRELAKTLLECETLNPMDRDYRGQEREPGIDKAIVENDKRDIDACDVVLVNYEKPSVGTSMEILYAWDRGIIVLLVARKDTVLSPWLTYHSDKIVNSLEEACKLINESSADGMELYFSDYFGDEHEY